MTDELHPLVVDGVRHASNCRLFAYWNGKDEPEKCSCGADRKIAVVGAPHQYWPLHTWATKHPSLAADEIQKLRGLVARADSLIRDIYSYAEDQSLETLMDMVDSFPRAADSADDVINAQHDETGRTWRGPRSQLPRRYFEITSICCLDYPRCDCNSPPEPDDDWLCFQRPAQPKVTP